MESIWPYISVDFFGALSKQTNTPMYLPYMEMKSPYIEINSSRIQ